MRCALRGVRSLVVGFFVCSVGLADQVVLKNGDRVTGEIVKKDGKNLTIKTAHFGVVNTTWEQVASITADTPVTVVMPGGKVAQGKLTTENTNISITGTDVIIPVAEVEALRNVDEQKAYERLLHPSWGRLWAGTANLGFAGTAGNAKTSTFTTGVIAARLTRKDKTSIYFNAIKASALIDGRTAGTAQAIRGGIAYDHNISPRLFVNVFNDYEYDRFQNLDLRFVAGGGFGFHVFKNERASFDLPAGGAYNRSKFGTPLTTNAAEVYWGDDYTYKLRGATSLVQSFRMFNDLTNTGGFRTNADVGITTKLIRWLTWNVSFSDRYLNRPAFGRKTNDLLYTTGVGVTFARQ